MANTTIIDTNYIKYFSAEWKEAVRALKKSKYDLSKIVIVEKTLNEGKGRNKS